MMHAIQNKPPYWQKLLIVIVIMTASIIAILSWFTWRTYIIQTERVMSSFKNESVRIDHVFMDTIDRTEFTMKTIGQQIKSNPQDIHYIYTILSKYKSNINVSNVLSWTVFSWLNADHQKLVDSTYGIVKKPLDMSMRTYVSSLAKEPNTIHLGTIAKGLTSNRWVIPAGLGVVDDTGKYLGAVTIGFDLEYLTLKLTEAAKMEGIDFAIIDQGMRIILKSSGIFPKNENIKDTFPKGTFASLLKHNNSETTTPLISNIHIFSNNNIYYLYKLRKYPYLVYLQYDKQLLRQEVWESLTSRSVEIILIAVIATLLIIFIYKREAGLRKETEEAHAEVRILNAHLEEALRVKTDFLNNLSHEIRIPMHGVIGYSTSLVEHWAHWTDEKRIYLAQKTQETTERLFVFLSDILDVSKLEAGKMTFDIKPYNITKIIERSLQECEPLTIGKDITFCYNAPEAETVIECDEGRLIQVIRDLLSNAIKFTAHGKITITLKPKLIVYEDNRRLKALSLMVSDEGVGIPEAEIGEIFNPFSQSSRTKIQGGGTGLGLAISREIVHAHHGRIWAENNQDIGATFTVRIPLTQPVPKQKTLKT